MSDNALYYPSLLSKIGNLRVAQPVTFPQNLA